MPSDPAVLLCRRPDESHTQRLLVFCYLSEVLVYLSEVLVFCYLSEVLVFCYLSEVNRTEDANWPKNIENVRVFSSEGFVWLFHKYVYSRSTSTF